MKCAHSNRATFGSARPAYRNSSAHRVIAPRAWRPRRVAPRAQAKRLAKEAERVAKVDAKEAERKAKEEAKETERKAKEDAKEAERSAKEDAKEAERKAKEDAKEAERKAKEDAKETERKAKEDAKEAERKAKEDAKEAEREARELEKRQQQEALSKQRITNWFVKPKAPAHSQPAASPAPARAAASAPSPAAGAAGAAFADAPALHSAERTAGSPGATAAAEQLGASGADGSGGGGLRLRMRRGDLRPFDAQPHMVLAPVLRVPPKPVLAADEERDLGPPADLGEVRARGLKRRRELRAAMRAARARARSWETAPLKTLHFHEDVRPAFHGTMCKRSAALSGRRPLGRALDAGVDYELDSEAEWESEPEGEELNSADEADDGEELGSAVGSEDEEGWLVDTDNESAADADADAPQHIDLTASPSAAAAAAGGRPAAKKAKRRAHKQLAVIAPVVVFDFGGAGFSSAASSLGALDCYRVQILEPSPTDPAVAALGEPDAARAPPPPPLEPARKPHAAAAAAAADGAGAAHALPEDGAAAAAASAGADGARAELHAPRVALSESQLPELLLLAHGSKAGLGKLVEAFQAAHPHVTKSSIERRIHACFVERAKLADPWQAHPHLLETHAAAMDAHVAALRADGANAAHHAISGRLECAKRVRTADKPAKTPAPLSAAGAGASAVVAPAAQPSAAATAAQPSAVAAAAQPSAVAAAAQPSVAVQDPPPAAPAASTVALTCAAEAGLSAAAGAPPAPSPADAQPGPSPAASAVASAGKAKAAPAPAGAASAARLNPFLIAKQARSRPPPTRDLTDDTPDPAAHAVATPGVAAAPAASPAPGVPAEAAAASPARGPAAATALATSAGGTAASSPAFDESKENADPAPALSRGASEAARADALPSVDPLSPASLARRGPPSDWAQLAAALGGSGALAGADAFAALGGVLERWFVPKPSCEMPHAVLDKLLLVAAAPADHVDADLRQAVVRAIGCVCVSARDLLAAPSADEQSDRVLSALVSEAETIAVLEPALLDAVSADSPACMREAAWRCLLSYVQLARDVKEGAGARVVLCARASSFVSTGLVREPWIARVAADAHIGFAAALVRAVPRRAAPRRAARRCCLSRLRGARHSLSLRTPRAPIIGSRAVRTAPSSPRSPHPHLQLLLDCTRPSGRSLSPPVTAARARRRRAAERRGAAQAHPGPGAHHGGRGLPRTARRHRAQCAKGCGAMRSPRAPLDDPSTSPQASAERWTPAPLTPLRRAYPRARAPQAPQSTACSSSRRPSSIAAPSLRAFGARRCCSTCLRRWSAFATRSQCAQ
jgi:hypothetical protein